jgi:tetratricopeptide (TPR) repeat protein
MQTIESLLPEMLDQLARSGDHRGLAKAHWLAFCVQWAASRATLAAEQARLSAEHAREAGDIGLWSRALGWHVATLIFGPHSADAIAEELDSIEQHEPGPYLRACLELGRAEVKRLESYFDDARRLSQSARDRFSSLGMTTMAATCDQSLASIALSEGDHEEALRSLLRSEAILAELGERVIRSTTQAMLGRAHERAGAAAAALAAVSLAEELSAPQDVANFAITHGVRARLSLASGDAGAAERDADRAVAYALKTDFLGLQAEARLGLAAALSAHGDAGRAVSEARTAFDLFSAKGDRPGGAAATALLESIGAKP